MAQLVMAQSDIDADRDAWLKARQQGITASEIAAVLGIAPKTHASAFALYTAKTTGEDWHGDNADMKRGRILEPVVAGEFAEQYPFLHLLPGGLYRHEDRPWQLATFDRLALDAAVVGVNWDLLDTSYATLPHVLSLAHPVQIKTAFNRDGWGEPYSSAVPEHYLVQALWEMDVQDASTVFMPCLFMQEMKTVTYIIDRAEKGMEERIEAMRDAGLAFLDRIRNLDPPEVDWTPATTAALVALHKDMLDMDVPVTKRLARRYMRALKARDRAAQQLGQAANEVRHAIGAGRRAIVADADGKAHTVASRRRSNPKRIDLERLRRERPDIAKEFEVQKPQDSLYPGNWKE